MSVYHVTEAGLQVERALEQGYDVAAWNLYFDAIRYGVALTVGVGDEEWHRDICERIGYTAEYRERAEAFFELAETVGDDPDEWPVEPPLYRDVRGRHRLRPEERA